MRRVIGRFPDYLLSVAPYISVVLIYGIICLLNGFIFRLFNARNIIICILYVFFRFINVVFNFSFVVLPCVFIITIRRAGWVFIKLRISRKA